jgi:hypothetical protein
MHHHRLGVQCRFCGQPIVREDLHPAPAHCCASQVADLAFLCASCGHRAHYSAVEWQTFCASEMSSGDWEAVTKRGDLRELPHARETSAAAPH